jgi:hypothetical protein
MNSTRHSGLCIVIALLLLAITPAAGELGDDDSFGPSFSSNDRYVTFYSDATNLVAGGTSGERHVFVRDRNTGINTLVSRSSAGVEGDFFSTVSSLSADGRYVAFQSAATNLVSGDINNKLDIFVRDRQTGTTTRISKSSAGAEGNGDSTYPSISSDDGRYVAFQSAATNLVAGDGDTNGKTDIFVRDRNTGSTYLVSKNSGGVEGNGDSGNPEISADGRYVTFESAANNLVTGDTNSVTDVFVRDRTTGTTTRVSRDSAGVQGNGLSLDPSISDDGRFVAFGSAATNLVSGDTNGERDVFVRDRQTGTTTKVSKSSAGVAGDALSGTPSISADGRYVVFESTATNLVSGDTNAKFDVFVRDRQTGTTTRVSKSSAGAEGNDISEYPTISADGRYVTFESDATNLVSGDTNGAVDVFVRDRQAGTTTRVSKSNAGVEGDDASLNPAISSDGRYVAFHSIATNLVSGDTNGNSDIFVRDRQTGTTTRVSRDSAGVEGNDDSYTPSISADGRYVTFESDATNLVSGDTNAMYDIFVRDRQTGTTTLVARDSAGVVGNGPSEYPTISSDGRYVAFHSIATNLVSGDTNAMYDIFVRDRQTGTTTLVSKS